MERRERKREGNIRKRENEGWLGGRKEDWNGAQVPHKHCSYRYFSLRVSK